MPAVSQVHTASAQQLQHNSYRQADPNCCDSKDALWHPRVCRGSHCIHCRRQPTCVNTPTVHGCMHVACMHFQLLSMAHTCPCHQPTDLHVSTVHSLVCMVHMCSQLPSTAGSCPQSCTNGCSRSTACDHQCLAGAAYKVQACCDSCAGCQHTADTQCSQHLVGAACTTSKCSHSGATHQLTLLACSTPILAVSTCCVLHTDTVCLPIPGHMAHVQDVVHCVPMAL